METRLKSDWMQTFNGKKFYVNDFRTEDVDIVDIAHALAMQCRYNGHCNYFYSVAEHSVLMANYVSKKNALWALLHDASEAYICDIPRPIKPELTNYKDIESRIMKVICDRFDISKVMPKEVKTADNGILIDEFEQNMNHYSENNWSFQAEKLGVELKLWNPQEAKLNFLEKFYELTRES